MRNKGLLIILGGIISAFIIMLAVAGAIYLVGNIMIGWSWLAFDICVSFAGILILFVGMIVLCVLYNK